MAKVDIIMAALNEEKKIGIAIESIIAQSYSDWRLLVCDDGSTDATMSTISRYADQHPGKIIFYRNTIMISISGNIKVQREIYCSNGCR